MEKLRIGVIGAGIMGRLHARIVHEHAAAELVGVYDTNGQRAAELAAQYGASACAELGQLLQLGLDALIVAVPDFLHYEPVMAALSAGKHVLVEKPLATEVSEAEAIAAKVRETGLKLMVNYSNRWIPAYLQAKREVESGRLGRILWAYARKNDTINVATEMLAWSAKSSPAWFLSSHDVDYVRWCFGAEAVEAYATGQKMALAQLGVETYDGIQAIVKFANGAAAIFESGWIYPNTFPTTVDSFIELVGSGGAIHIDRTRESLAVTTAAGHLYPKTSITVEVAGRLQGALPTSVGLFIEAVLEGKEPPVTVWDGLAVTRILAAIHRSLELGGAISVQ